MATDRKLIRNSKKQFNEKLKITKIFRWVEKRNKIRNESEWAAKFSRGKIVIP